VPLYRCNPTPNARIQHLQTSPKQNKKTFTELPFLTFYNFFITNKYISPVYDTHILSFFSLHFGRTIVPFSIVGGEPSLRHFVTLPHTTSNTLSHLYSQCQVTTRSCCIQYELYAVRKLAVCISIRSKMKIYKC